MVLGHLAVGIALGILAAGASLLTGFSFVAALAMYVLGANVGVLASAVYAASPQMPGHATEHGWV